MSFNLVWIGMRMSFNLNRWMQFCGIMDLTRNLRFWWFLVKTHSDDNPCMPSRGFFFFFFQKEHVPGLLGPVYVISLILDMKKTRKVISRRLDRVSARNVCSRPLSWRFLFWPENHENAGFVCVCGWARMSFNLTGLRRVCQVCVVTSNLVYAVVQK